MRTLVVGTTPPPGGQPARELAVIVGERMRAGDDVEVFSPDARSAAHHTGNLTTVMLPFRLALMARRFDSLVLRIEPGLPFGSQTGRLVRGITLFGLGAVFGMFSEVVLRLDSPIAIPGGVGGRATADLWRRASVIVVADENDRRQLLDAPGLDAESVVIGTSPVVGSANVDSSWPSATEENLREQILDRIRQRAQAERRANSARVDLGASDVGPLVAEVFSSESRPTSGIATLARATYARVAREVSARRSSSD